MHINKKRNKKRNITTSTTVIQRIIRNYYYEKLHTKKLGTLERMDKFLEICKLPRLNHEEIENLNRLTTIKEIQSVIKNLQTKAQSDGFTGEFYQTFKEELILIHLKLFPEIAKEGNL